MFILPSNIANPLTLIVSNTGLLNGTNIRLPAGISSVKVCEIIGISVSLIAISALNSHSTISPEKLGISIILSPSFKSLKTLAFIAVLVPVNVSVIAPIILSAS
jgi:hypothetical protein